VARLAIAEGSLAEYTKLDRDVQGAPDAAIAKFARHAKPGLYLEKPQHGWDDRIWITGVDDRWRGVVLAPATRDAHCLVTVLPQDKANAYTTTHWFSVNPAVGVLEVRDEEAIQQLQPSLQAAAEPDGERLFADVSDAEPTRLGVDAQILPTVRLLTREADLERPQTVLPEPHYAARYALACGMTVDEVAWLLSADTPPERVDLHVLVFAMSALPGRSPLCLGRRGCSQSWLTRSWRGARSCTQASTRSPADRATPAQLK
jgi:hypothetical protein